MQAALKGPHLIVDNDEDVRSSEDLKNRLQRLLRLNKVKLIKRGLSTFKSWDVDRRRTILFLGYQTSRPYCLVTSALARELSLIGENSKIFTITISTTRTFSRGAPQLFQLDVDAVRVLYAHEEYAFIVDAEKLLSMLR